MSLRDRFRPAAQRAPAPPDPELESRAAQALAGRRGRASIAAAPKAGKAAASLLRPLLPQGGLGLTEMKRRWPEIVGEPFGSKTSPEKLASGVLTLRVPGALAPFLQQQIPLLVERLRLAGAQVKSVRIEQRTAAPVKAPNVRPLRRKFEAADEAALAQSLDHIQDPGLRSALMRLGRAVKQG